MNLLQAGIWIMSGRAAAAYETHSSFEVRTICDTNAAKLAEVRVEEVFRAMAVCFAAEESLNTGRPVGVGLIQVQML